MAEFIGGIKDEVIRLGLDIIEVDIMKHLSEKLRNEMAERHIQGAGTLAGLATEYGVSKASVSNWVRAYRKECQKDEQAMIRLELMEEINRLKKEKSEIEKENDFLKKARAFFAKKTEKRLIGSLI